MEENIMKKSNQEKEKLRLKKAKSDLLIGLRITS